MQAIREFDRKINPFFDQSGGIGILIACASHHLERSEQSVEVLREKLLTKCRIAARPRDFVLADQSVHSRTRSVHD